MLRAEQAGFMGDELVDLPVLDALRLRLRAARGAGGGAQPRALRRGRAPRAAARCARCASS